MNCHMYLGMTQRELCEAELTHLIEVQTATAEDRLCEYLKTSPFPDGITVEQNGTLTDIETRIMGEPGKQPVCLENLTPAMREHLIHAACWRAQQLNQANLYVTATIADELPDRTAALLHYMALISVGIRQKLANTRELLTLVTLQEYEKTLYAATAILGDPTHGYENTWTLYQEDLTHLTTWLLKETGDTDEQ